MKSQKLLLNFLFIFIASFCTLLKIEGQINEKNIDLDLVYIGNSITQGVQLENPEIDSPPATASEYLSHKPQIRKLEFVNQGRSGFTTLDYLPSINGALKEVLVATRNLHRDSLRLLIFSISLGTNDSAEKGPNGSPVRADEYHKNLKLIANELLLNFPECKIIFQQPIWYSPNTYNRSKYMSEGLARLQSYFPELQSLVKEFALTNPGHVFIGDLTGFTYFKNNYLSELIPETGNAGTFYLHPNKKGAIELGKLWGESIYQCISKN
jgi:lysophospholipase L1-like esterase